LEGGNCRLNVEETEIECTGLLAGKAGRKGGSTVPRILGAKGNMGTKKSAGSGGLQVAKLPLVGAFEGANQRNSGGEGTQVGLGREKRRIVRKRMGTYRWGLNNAKAPSPDHRAEWTLHWAT